MTIRLRLLFLAIDCALCVALATFWLVVAVTNGEWRLVGSLLAAVWMTFTVWISQDFARARARHGGEGSHAVPSRVPNGAS